MRVRACLTCWGARIVKACLAVMCCMCSAASCVWPKLFFIFSPAAGAGLARATDLQVECLLYFKTDYHC